MTGINILEVLLEDRKTRTIVVPHGYGLRRSVFGWRAEARDGWRGPLRRPKGRGHRPDGVAAAWAAGDAWDRET